MFAFGGGNWILVWRRIFQWRYSPKSILSINEPIARPIELISKINEIRFVCPYAVVFFIHNVIPAFNSQRIRNLKNHRKLAVRRRTAITDNYEPCVLLAAVWNRN